MAAIGTDLAPDPPVKIEAHIEHGTLARLLRELAPVRIHMTPPDEGTRWLELDEPSLIQPVPGRGLRLEAAGRFRFDLLRVPLRVEIRRLRLLLEPVVVEKDRSLRLAFAMDIEEGDLVGVPSAIEAPLVRRVNRALSPQDTKLVWNFGETLSKRFALPPRLEPVDALSLAASAGEVVVDRDAVHFSIRLEPEVHRHELQPVDDDEERPPTPAEAIDPRLLLGGA